MTNKKKTTRSSTKSESLAAKKQSAIAVGSIPSTTNNNDTLEMKKPGTFTRAQLCVLITFTLGTSRLVQVGSALTATGTADTDTCHEYLGQEACADAAVASLIRYKYLLGIQVALLLANVVLQFWNNEGCLLRLNVLLIVTPIALSVAAHSAAGEWIPKGKTIRHLTMCIVMTVLASPSDTNSVPFFAGRKQPYKTLQSLAVMSLGITNMWEAVQLLLPVVNGEPYTAVASILNVTSASSATTAVIYLIAVDKITNAALYAFSWFYMEESRQRVSIMVEE
jgi:hypothetical protein